VAYTPTLFTHGDASKGVYSSGEPLVVDGRYRAPVMKLNGTC
jgi:hypothetical protein